MTKIDAPFIPVHQHGKTFYLTSLPAKILTNIAYASVRGKDDEEGAVQRVLSPRRIASVKNFALNGGDFPNAVILNWLGELDVHTESNRLTFVPKERMAQLIDGQHREAGLKEAIAEDPSFANFPIPVVIYTRLSTKECAEIFLAINTEQKPVPRSLVYDLYGIVNEQFADTAIVRAQDVARVLNEFGAPYHGMIKFPGEPPRKGGVALSTVVTSIRPLIEENGVLDQVGLSSFETQSKLILNFFDALRSAYGDQWPERSNALIYAAGFAGALDFLSKRLLPFCVHRKSFTSETMLSALDINENNLIRQNEVSGRGGTDAQRHVFNRLDEMFSPDNDLEDFEI